MGMGWRVTLVLFVVLMAGCATAPAPPVSSSPTIPPCPPPKLKGWQKPYEVFGVAYTPLLDHQGFVEQGIASWYGKDFHGRKTSNGEVYDMYAMTAAHKTLPLGVFVKVENLRNGSSEVVRVNDRGPFVAGRIIDLSYTAANRLGVVGPGTAPVKVTALGYQVDDGAGHYHYTLPESIQTGPFAIQVGAFTRQDNASRLAETLRGQYGQADIRPAWVRGQQFYRVRAGEYHSLAEAEQARQALQQAGYAGGFVVAID